MSGECCAGRITQVDRPDQVNIVLSKTELHLLIDWMNECCNMVHDIPEEVSDLICKLEAVPR